MSEEEKKIREGSAVGSCFFAIWRGDNLCLCREIAVNGTVGMLAEYIQQKYCLDDSYKIEIIPYSPVYQEFSNGVKPAKN